MMRKAIVVVEAPDNEMQWKAFLNASGMGTANDNVQELATNVWEIDFAASPTAFAQLVHAMKQFGLPGRILQLDADSQWLPVDSNPAPK